MSATAFGSSRGPTNWNVRDWRMEVVSGEREKLSANTRVLETLNRRLDEYL